MDESKSVYNVSPNVNTPDTITLNDNKQPFIINDKPPEDFSNLCIFKNVLHNSRSAVKLGENLWEEKWKVKVEKNLKPKSILFCNNRIILYGDTEWLLFDVEGKLLNSGSLGYTEINISPDNNQFYYSDYNGLIQARDLINGAYKFSLFAMFADNYRRSEIFTNNRLIYILSKEEKEDPHGNHIRNSSVLEVQDIGEPRSIDDNDYLISANRLNTIDLRSLDVYSVFTGEYLILAIPDEILITDSQLKIKKIIKSKFIPLSMSLDQSGRIYLIVRYTAADGNQKTGFWIITQDGLRILNLDLPSDNDFNFPPVIGYNSKVFLIAGNKVFNIDTNIHFFSEKIFETPLGGFTISKDNKLILSAGKLIYGLDDYGENIYITHLENENWATGPVFINNDTFICASSESLYCFTRGLQVR
ncbi:MAG: hypothetical protein ABI638_10405 [Ignavibacteriota bacterium]